VRTAQGVYRAARDGNRVARRVVRTQARQLALAIAAAASVLDPQLIVVSGTVDETVAGPMREALRSVIAAGPALVTGHLGEEAVLLGAIAAALPQARERVFAGSRRP